MEDVELRLVGDNKDVIKKIKEVIDSTQKLTDVTVQNGTKQKQTAESIAKSMKDLFNEQKKGFSTTAQIDAYTKKMEGLKKELDSLETSTTDTKKATDNLEQSQDKATKTGGTLLKSVGQWALGFATVAGALKVFKDTIAATEQGLRALNIIGAVTKQLLAELVSGGKLTFKGVIKDVKSVIQTTKEIDELRKKQRVELVEIAKAQRTYNELYTASLDQTKSESDRLMLINEALTYHEFMMDKKIDNAKNDLFLTRKLLEVNKNNTALLDKEASLLVTIENLEGERSQSIRRLESQRTGFIKEASDKVTEARNKEALETLQLQGDVYDYLEKLDKDYFKALDENAKAKLKRDQSYFDFELAIARDNFAKITAEGKEAGREREKNDELAKEKAIKNEEDIAEAKKELRYSAADFAMSLYDRQLTKLEQNYNREIKAAGNNERLKEEIEEKYARKKNEISRKAAIAEKAFALFSIFLDIRKAIMNAMSKIITWPLAIIATGIGALQAGMVLAKPIPQYAEGGWTGEGKHRDSSGERMAGIVHEREFVVRKGPAHKFRNVLEAINRDDKRMIFNSFNKLTPELAGATNNILVENTGPNKRLDEVNQNLRKMAAKEEIMIMGNLTIIKKGNSVRTIRR